MKVKLFTFLGLVSCALSGYSQNDAGEVKQTIIENDSIFWVAYNTCDLTTMASYLSDDAEFYHDKGGISKSGDTIMSITKRNLCSNRNFRLRREAIQGTVEVYVLSKNNIPYGAIISGEHAFYINETGKDEFLDGQARFTHLWLLDKGEWKMTRILSYDHGPARRG